MKRRRKTISKLGPFQRLRVVWQNCPCPELKL
uniref:Uncharacterized protein n=1 Tax=Anguilla anguilla TaxID=7936 RepID=A0A0E9XDE6_ANGAN